MVAIRRFKPNIKSSATQDEDEDDEDEDERPRRLASFLARFASFFARFLAFLASFFARFFSFRSSLSVIRSGARGGGGTSTISLDRF